MAIRLYLASMAILNGRLADSIFSWDQVRYGQLPEPAPRPASARLAFSVRDNPQVLLGAPQGLLRYPGVSGLLDDVSGRNRTIGQDVAQELYCLAKGICVILVLRCA